MIDNLAVSQHYKLLQKLAAHQNFSFKEAEDLACAKIYESCERIIQKNQKNLIENESLKDFIRRHLPPFIKELSIKTEKPTDSTDPIDPQEKGIIVLKKNRLL